MAPAGILFDAQGLSTITAPVRVYRAADDRLVQNTWNADHVARLLPRAPEVVTVPGNHFIFLAPCPPALAAEVPVACEDSRGIDRARIHDEIAAQLVDFFDGTLGR
jgi:predicted dienelactone hydrolase